LSRGLYKDLVLPWDVKSPVSAFANSDFVRQEWDRDGILTNGEDFFLGSRESTLEDLEKTLGTACMVTRWREAHPELVGTPEDCVRSTMNEIRRVLNEEIGGEETENYKIRSGAAMVLLLFKRVGLSAQETHS
jgi:hypothetical protein